MTENKNPSIVDSFVTENRYRENLASIGARFFATIIDSLILFPVVFLQSLMVRMILPTPFSSLSGFVLHFLYCGFFYSQYGKTPGKMLLGVRVVDLETGKNPSFLMGACRDSIGKLIDGMTLLIGYLIAFFRQDKRALHDLLFGTIVIRDEKN